MEVGSGGAPSDVLLQRPWLPVSVSGCQLLSKTWFGDSEYHVLLTDMICVWEERMDSASIQSRAQELNRRLRAPVRAFFSHLCQVVQPCLSGGGGQLDGDAQISLTRGEEGDVSLKLKSELAGLPFYWEFHCTPAPVTMVCAQLVCPLLDMSRLLHRQVEQLGALLLRKDAEIQDYKENGATLSRERLQTDVFEEQTYREDFLSKALPLVCSQQRGDNTLGFGADLQLLYAAIAAHTSTRKRKVPEEDEEEEERPAATQEPDVSQSFGGGSVVTQSAESDRDLSNNGQSAEKTRAKMADSAAAQQSAAATSKPAERTQSKPKKKKVGLFR